MLGLISAVILFSVVAVTKAPGQENGCSVVISQKEGKTDVVLENKFFRMVMGNPGGRCKSLLYKKANKDLVFTSTSVFEGLFVDRICLDNPPAGGRNDYSQTDYSYEIEKNGPEEAVVHFYLTENKPVPFLQIHKRITIFRDKSFIKVDYAFMNSPESEMPLNISTWFHQSLGVAEESNTYYTPIPEGISSLDSSSQKSGATFFFYDPTRGWSAVISESRVGLAVEVVDYRKMLWFMNWFPDNRVADVEWALDRTQIEPGKSFETTFYLIPFSNLDSPAGVANNLVCSIKGTEKTLKEGPVPFVVKLYSAQERKVKLYLRYKVLPSQEWVEIGQEDLVLNTDEVAEVKVTLKPDKEGTYVVGCLVEEEGNPLLVAEKPVVIGKKSGKYALAPLEEREAKQKKTPPIGELSEAIVTPHIKWAKPYYKGKVKAFILPAFSNQREVVELAQRMDLEFSSSMAENYLAEFGIQTPYTNDIGVPTILQDIDKKLQDNYDVIVIAGIKWSFLSEGIRKEIIKKVEEGTGFIYICPPETPEELEKVLGTKLLFDLKSGSGSGSGKWKKTKEDFLTNGIPFPFLPETAYYKYSIGQNQEVRSEINGDPLLITGKYGKGKTAVLTYGAVYIVEASEFGAGLTPLGARGNNLDYYYSWLAKILLWAAQKEPEIFFKEIKAEGNLLSLSLTNSGGEKEVELGYRVRDEYSSLEKEEQQTVLLSSGTRDMSIPLPGLKIGDHLVDCFIKTSKGEIINWASTSLSINRTVSMEKVETEKEVYRKNEAPAVKISLSALSPDYLVRCSLKDNYGRLLQREEKGLAASSLSFNFKPVAEPLTTFFWVEAELFKGQDLIQVKKKRFVITPSREWKDFEVVMWPQRSLFQREYLLAYEQESFKDMGVTAVMAAYPAELIAGSNLKCFGWQMCSIGADANRGAYLETLDKKYLVNVPCFNDPGWLESVKNTLQRGIQLSGLKNYGPLGYMMGDENYIYSHGANVPVDACFSKYCLSEMRNWLKGQYLSLDALNKEWETRFATWEEVVPMTLEEVKSRGNNNFSPWADHRSFMDTTLANAFHALRKIVKETDPEGRMGISGPYTPLTYTGYDYWKLRDCLDYLHSYLTSTDFNRSFMKIPIGDWSGYGGEGDHLYWATWLTLFEGDKFLSLWYAPMFIKPDLTYWQAGKDMKAINQELNKGIGMLFMNIQLSQPEVAIHYSQASIHASYILEGEDAFTTNRDGYTKVLQDLSIPYKFVSYEEVEEGGLIKGNYKVLILPYSSAISPREAEEIEKFVGNGGLVIGDFQIGIMDNHGKKVEKGLLDDLFGLKRQGGKLDKGKSKLTFKKDYQTISFLNETLVGKYIETEITADKGTALAEEKTTKAPALIINEYGKGKTVYLNSLLYGEYHFYRRNVRAPNLKKQFLQLQSLLSSTLRLAGIKRDLQITTPEGEDLLYYQVAYFEEGQNKYIGILRDNPTAKVNDPETRKARIVFPYKSHLYDVRNKKYYGYTDRIEKDFSPAEIKLYALLPYPIENPSLELNEAVFKPGDVLNYKIELKASKEKTGTHIVRLKVYNPSGELVSYYTKNLLLEDGRYAGQIFLSLNEAGGNWKIVAEEIVSGKKTQREFQVKKP